MASEYVRLHIIKHALEHYIKRDGASEKDISKLENGKRGITEQKEEAMKMLLREHRLKIKRANSYTRPKREKICFAYPWYSYQKK